MSDDPKPNDCDVFKWEMSEASGAPTEAIPAEWLKDPKLAACIDPTSSKLVPVTKEEWGRTMDRAGLGNMPLPDHVWTCDGRHGDFTAKGPVDWSKKPRISFFSQPYGDGGSSTTGFFVVGGDQDRLDRACRELGIPSGSILSDDDMRRVFAYFGCETAW